MCPEAGQRRRCPQVGAAAGGRHRRQAEPLQAWGGWGTASSHPSPSPADPNTGSTVGVLAVLTLITGASTVPTHGATLSATIRAGNAGPVRHEQCAPGTAGDCRASLGSAAWLQLQEPRGAGQLMTSGQVRRRGGLETSVTSREGDVHPAGPRREMCVLQRDLVRRSRCHSRASEHAARSGWCQAPSCPPGPAVIGCLLRPTQSGGLPSAQVSWPAPAHLMPDAGKGGPALPVWFTHHVGPPG